MSDFLLNLARRSAGLAPVVHPRSVPAVSSAEASSETAAAAWPRETAPAPQGVVLTGAAPTAPAAPTVEAPRAAAPAPQVAITPAAPIAQRVVATLPAASAAPAARAPTGADVSPVVARLPIAVAPAAGERAVAHVTTPPASVSQAAAARIDRPRPSRPEDSPAIVPAALARTEAPGSTRHDERGRDAVHEDARVDEHVLAPGPRDELVPAVVTIQPAPLAMPTRPAPSAGPEPERTVHVRIGAIEIYGPDTGPGPQTAGTGAPAPLASAAALPAPAGGFDEYAALRCYAPWAW